MPARYFSLSIFFAVCIFAQIGSAQNGSALQSYQDSLVAEENHLVANTKEIQVAQEVQNRLASLKTIVDPFALVASCAQVDSQAGGNLGLAAFIAGSQQTLGKITDLRVNIDEMELKLVEQDTSTARGRKQSAVLEKKLRKSQGAVDSLSLSLLVPVRNWIDQKSVERDAEIVRRKAESAQTELRITDLKWKIEMEVLHERTLRGLLSPPPSTIPDLLKAYADILDAASRDKLHNYDTIMTAAGRMADGFLRNTLAKQHRDERVLIPKGETKLASGETHTSRGLIISKTPILQPDVLTYYVAVGERGVSFARTLRAAIDRPAEHVPLDTLAQVAVRFGGRLLSSDDREFVEASGFSSLEERHTYGVLSNFYDLPLNDRYAYVCWDADSQDAALIQELDSRLEAVQRQKEEYVLESWHTGAVYNPKRFLVSFGGIATAYLFQHMDASSGNMVRMAGFGFGSPSLLLGYRYAIDGTEAEGERYGFVGLACSYTFSFGKVVKAFGTPEPKEATLNAHGFEAALIATLLRSFYLGAGLGSVQGAITTTYKGTQKQDVIVSEDLGVFPGYYVFPFGFVLRAGTNFSFNLGGAVRWKGIYSNPSVFFGLGFMVDIPLVRTGG
jgi:hypothetical protein